MDILIPPPTDELVVALPAELLSGQPSLQWPPNNCFLHHINADVFKPMLHYNRKHQQFPNLVVVP